MPSEPVDATHAPGTPRDSLTPLHWTAIALAAVTGAVHLWLGIGDGKPPLVVAGVGFAVGIAAVALDVRRRRVVELGVPFTAGQTVLSAIGHFPDEFGTVGVLDKTVQIALVAALVALLGRE